jgi:hypothetical protein
MPPRSIDLTIPFAGLDTDALLSEWRWCVPEDYTPIQMTRFGDWFFADPKQRVHMLDLIEGTLHEVAESISAYNELKDTPEKQGEWFLDGFVFRCVEEGLLLDAAQCYGWRVHPMLGGKFDFENIQVFSLSVYQSLMGQIFRQCRNLNPGDPMPPLQIDQG